VHAAKKTIIAILAKELHFCIKNMWWCTKCISSVHRNWSVKK